MPDVLLSDIVDAVDEYDTVGEICNVIRRETSDVIRWEIGTGILGEIG